MFDIGMPEFMIIGVVALVVLGPERLPEIMGKLSRGYLQSSGIPMSNIDIGKTGMPLCLADDRRASTRRSSL